MKIRGDFVTNSSSSSFVCIMVGDKTIVGDEENLEECWDDQGSYTLNIEELISQLAEAKKNGETTVEIHFGGGYDG